jgi:hypothetical protein
MVDEKALKHALTTFRGFRSHVFGLITVPIVDEYHSILAMLQKASDENLYDFKIPESMMRPRFVAEVKHYRTPLHAEIETQLSSQKYCDKNFFKGRMDQLWEHFAQAPGVHPSWQSGNPFQS